MTGPFGLQILLGIVLAVPTLVIFGTALMLAIGGIMGCAECVLARLGAIRFAPGVAKVGHRMATP